MNKAADYLLITALAILQSSFLPADLVLLLLLFWLLRRGFGYFLPRVIFASLILGIFTSSSIGLLIFVFSLVAAVVFALKTYLPSALFVRVALLVLALPLAESLYRGLFSWWGAQ